MIDDLGVNPGNGDDPNGRGHGNAQEATVQRVAPRSASAEVATESAGRLHPVERYGARVTLFASALLIVFFPFATLLFEVGTKGPITRMDSRVADNLNDWIHRRAGVLTALKLLTPLGQLPIEAVVVLGAVAWLLRRRPPRRRSAIFLIATSLLGGAVNTLVKVAVDRPRPVVDHPVATAFGMSFPSGHAMSSTIVYGGLLVVFYRDVPRRGRPVVVAATVVLIAAVGASRLLLGVHFVSDVIGGFLLGLAWLLASVAAFHTWR